MDSIEVDRLQRRARWAYEVGRLRLALLGISPLVVVVAIAACLAHRPMSTFWFGLAALLVGAAMLWYGREPQKAVFPAVVAGLVPLMLALCASHLHTCGPDGCTSWCVPACALGGVVAGLAVATVGNQRGAGLFFWLSGSGLAMLTGAMGCSCLGYSGVAGLGLGLASGLVPGLLRRALRRRSP